MGGGMLLLPHVPGSLSTDFCPGGGWGVGACWGARHTHTHAHPCPLDIERALGRGTGPRACCEAHVAWLEYLTWVDRWSLPMQTGGPESGDPAAQLLRGPARGLPSHLQACAGEEAPQGAGQAQS